MLESPCKVKFIFITYLTYVACVIKGLCGVNKRTEQICEMEMGLLSFHPTSFMSGRAFFANF